MFVRSRGMGLYPQEQCYDSQRPFWLPYFINDFTESACLSTLPAGTLAQIAASGRVSVPSPPAPAAPGVPNVSMTEAPTSGEEAAAAAQDVSNRQIADWQASLSRFVHSLPSSGDDGGDGESWWDKYGNWVIVGILGFAVWKVAKG